MRPRLILSILISGVLATSPAAAQFAPPRARAAGVGVRNVVSALPTKPRSVREQQTSWVHDATRQALTRINFMPKSSTTATVSAFTQRNITAYADNETSAFNYGREYTPDDCEVAIRSAERQYHIPPYLLSAIALAESGRNGRPSPVAMNIAGRAYFASGTDDMERVVYNNGGQGASIDVGCMQVNLRFHAGRFRDWRSLLVPRYNADYAALYLTELYRQYGSWSAAVGAYHSRTPWRSADYACLISRKWGQIFGSNRDGCGPAIEPMAQLMYRTYTS